MDKTEMVILGVLVISVIILVYMLISYFLPSNSQSSQSGGFYSDTPASKQTAVGWAVVFRCSSPLKI